MLQALTRAQREPARSRDLVAELLSALRVEGLIGTDVSSENVDRLKRALASAGWYLTASRTTCSPDSTERRVEMPPRGGTVGSWSSGRLTLVYL